MFGSLNLIKVIYDLMIDTIILFTAHDTRELTIIYVRRAWQ